MSEQELEEICIGHLFFADDIEQTTKECLLSVLKAKQTPGRTILFAKGEERYKNGNWHRLSQNDMRVLRETGTLILGCDSCIADEKNKQCSGYRPIKLHVYNVLPKEDSQ